VVILFVLAATSIVTWLALSMSERDMKSVIGQQQFNLLSVAAAHIDEQLATKRLLLAAIADAVPPGQRTPANIRSAIERHASASAEFANVAAAAGQPQRSRPRLLRTDHGAKARDHITALARTRVQFAGGRADPSRHR
jgi:hypothetical protein